MAKHGMLGRLQSSPALAGQNLCGETGHFQWLSCWHARRAELLRGPLYYVLVLMAATTLYWRESPIGVVAFSLMCGGDGMGPSWDPLMSQCLACCCIKCVSTGCVDPDWQRLDRWQQEHKGRSARNVALLCQHDACAWMLLHGCVSAGCIDPDCQRLDCWQHRSMGARLPKYSAF